jgi:hypothetical protein
MVFDVMDKFLNKVQDERMRVLQNSKRRGVRKGSYLIWNQ